MVHFPLFHAIFLFRGAVVGNSKGVGRGSQLRKVLMRDDSRGMTMCMAKPWAKADEEAPSANLLFLVKMWIRLVVVATFVSEDV